MKKNVKYHFDFVGDKLIIEKFCMIASDVKFILNGANHLTDSFSTYPFAIFGKGWENKALQVSEMTPSSEILNIFKNDYEILKRY